MRVGLLTGGGDAPGLNGIIEAICRVLLNADCEVIGIQDGFEGIFENRVINITLNDIYGIHAKAGTFLGTSNRCGTENREREFLSCYKKLKLDGLIVAGGDGTFRGLQAFKEHIPIIGVPKTIDNDLPGTDATFGFDTACSVVCKAVDSLRTTAKAHRRILVVETMGRTAGWISLAGGMSAYADVILVPERPFEKDKLLAFLREKNEQQRGLIIVCSEGVVIPGDEVERVADDSGQSEWVHHYGIGKRLAEWIEKEIDWETRAVVLGHLQRSADPTTTDRFLTMAMGVSAAKLAIKQKWNHAVVLKQGYVQDAPIENLMGQARNIPKGHRWVRMAQACRIFI